MRIKLELQWEQALKSAIDYNKNTQPLEVEIVHPIGLIKKITDEKITRSEFHRISYVE